MVVKTTQVVATVNLPPPQKNKAPPLQKQDLMS